MLGDPMTDLTIAMEVDYFRLARDRYFVPVTLKIPGSELELAKHGGAESTRIDFIGEVKDAKGQVQGNVRDISDVKLKGETAASSPSTTHRLRHRLHPGARHLHHQVPGARKRDRQDGNLRSASSSIPDLTTEQKRLPISSVILSNQRQDLNAAVFNAEKDKKLLAANPAGAGQQEADSQRDPRLPQGPGHVRLPGGLRARRPTTTSRWWPP